MKFEKGNNVRRRRKPAPLIGRRLIRTYLRKGNKKHGIKPAAFETLSFLGKKFIEKIVMKLKTEMTQCARANNAPTSISPGHISMFFDSRC